MVFFLNNKLISIAELNAKALDLGQVGGVYTTPAFRQKGYSKSVMKQLLIDANQHLYKFLGAFQVGYFALFFGKFSEK